jgi:hypothetical protein
MATGTTTPQAGPTPSSRPPARTRAASGTVDRRMMIAAAALLGIVIIGGILVVSFSVDSGPRKDTQGQLQEDGGAKPHIIERPNSGHAPTNPGDRGGWEQLGLLSLIIVAVSGIGVVAFRGARRRPRPSRAAWEAAASSDHDGAVD